MDISAGVESKTRKSRIQNKIFLSAFPPNQHRYIFHFLLPILHHLFLFSLRFSLVPLPCFHGFLQVVRHQYLLTNITGRVPTVLNGKNPIFLDFKATNFFLMNALFLKRTSCEVFFRSSTVAVFLPDRMEEQLARWRTDVCRTSVVTGPGGGL